ncbi:MAG: hypothetical protein ACLU9S_13795 [Oscillospiraceae bacterium]
MQLRIRSGGGGRFRHARHGPHTGQGLLLLRQRRAEDPARQVYRRTYRYVVIDNEAGLEHIARGTLPHVDTMLLISDCSRRGVQAVARIAEMIGELDLKPGELGLIINRAPGRSAG